MINELNMVAVKQYLENSWYRWASQDRQTWYAAQYQYGYGVNTRDMKNWVCLAWWEHEIDNFSSWINVFTAFWDIYYINWEWKIYDENWTLKCSTWVTDSYAPLCVEFWNALFVIWDEKIKFVANNRTMSPDISPLFPQYHGRWYRWMWQCALNYANTFLLIWDDNVLWRLDWDTWIVKGIRYFNSWYTIFWLTQEWNYLKIYTSNWLDTKIHYAKGTFDVEDTWLVQTITYPWLAINVWDVTADQWNDYVIFRQSQPLNSSNYKIAKVHWYNKIDIRWTQRRWWQEIFTSSNPTIYASDWVVFAWMSDGIWTFTEYNWWLWWWCCEFPISWDVVTSMVKYWEKLYAVIKYWNRFKLVSYDMSFHPETYQRSWYIIGRVFDWWCAWLFKKNVHATVTYNMPTWTNMELSYRYDRSSFDYSKSNFSSIKNLTDTNSCYDIVVPTTDNDFNRTWNLLEYRFDFNWNWNKTPILFEHNLLYNDSIRKYR